MDTLMIPIATVAMRLKENLKIILKQRDLTASQLARGADVPKQSIGEWLNGSTPKDIAKVKRVADYLELSFDQLCFEDIESARGKKLKLADTDTNIEDLLGDKWISGLFEIRLRRVKR